MQPGCLLPRLRRRRGGSTSSSSLTREAASITCRRQAPAGTPAGCPLQQDGAARRPCLAGGMPRVGLQCRRHLARSGGAWRRAQLQQGL